LISKMNVAELEKMSAFKRGVQAGCAGIDPDDT
jgi:hypothetical protein